MENPPSWESASMNEERELSFEEQFVLADALSHAVDERNKFIEGYGGFDTFAEAWQHVGDNRAVYEKLEAAVTQARQELDQKVPDKKAFVGHLRDAGHEDLAKGIASMFGVKGSKGDMLSRFRKNHRRSWLGMYGSYEKIA